MILVKRIADQLKRGWIGEKVPFVIFRVEVMCEGFCEVCIEKRQNIKKIPYCGNIVDRDTK